MIKNPPAVNPSSLSHKRKFIVDASLLAELGERLIGRAPIALAELVKNSYDADATTCRIEFRPGEIIVSDDGMGMSKDDFLDYWMRLGTTHKIDKGVSDNGRPLTGSKGIGRLSVQFLADEMELESTSGDESGESLYAIVDWSKAIRGKDLDTVEVLWDMIPRTPPYPNGSQTGTWIRLTRMKSTWDAEAIEALGREVWRLRSPFRQKSSGDRRRPEEFSIEIEAPSIADARERFDKVFRAVFDNWRARIRGTLDQGRSGERASVTVEFRADYPDGATRSSHFSETVGLPIINAESHSKSLVDRAQFDILIFKTVGRQSGGISVDQLRDYLAEFGNVSVYDAGFRLPYYGSGRDTAGQDWLGIAVDQGRRLSISQLLPEHLQTPNRYLLDLPAPGRIFGTVDIDTNHERLIAERVDARPGEWLQIQPGRDRLHDSPAFHQLRDLVRFSLDYYANRYALRALRAAERNRPAEQPSQKYHRAIKVLDRSKAEMPAPIYKEFRRVLSDARKASKAEEESLDRRAAMLAPLATAGMAALALSHELAREGRFLSGVARRLRRLARQHGLSELASLAKEFSAAQVRLRGLQSLFAPLLSEDDTEPVARLKVRSVVDQVVRSMSPLMPGVVFDRAGIPANLRFPFGASAEWSALLQNVLSNAWNAMLDCPNMLVEFRGGRRKRMEWLHISDTGVGLDIPVKDAVRLFEPFERRLVIPSQKSSIALGGQGLGLAIVRMIASRRNTTVAFVEPDEGFSTTLEVSWKAAAR